MCLTAVSVFCSISSLEINVILRLGSVFAVFSQHFHLGPFPSLSSTSYWLWFLLCLLHWYFLFIQVFNSIILFSICSHFSFQPLKILLSQSVFFSPDGPWLLIWLWLGLPTSFWDKPKICLLKCVSPSWEIYFSGDIISSSSFNRNAFLYLAVFFA